MAIKYLDGKRLYRTLHAGLQKVLSREDYLNKINVFPVPDSDTGTNMAVTLTAIKDGIDENDHPDINAMSQKIADSALDGARGNSGVILAQFLVGFANGLKDRITISTEQFSEAVHEACVQAYDALIEPREGTILTVIREWSESVHDHSSKLPDFSQMLHNSLERAQVALKETRDKLDVLKKANVVDAGAQGFVYLLEGMQDFITSGKIRNYTRKKDREMADPVVNYPLENELESKYRYCTECTVNGRNLDKKTLRKKLDSLGDSTVVAGNDKKLKVHIHTDDPQSVFELCRQSGLVSGEKADDMLRQQKHRQADNAEIAVVMDSACDLPEDVIQAMNIQVVPVKLGFGDEHFIDGIGITPEEFWAKTAASAHHPKTSQPSPGDFRRHYELLKQHFKTIISIHIPAGSSGTFQSAMMAAKTQKNVNIELVDSMNLTVGAGLIALRAAEAIEAGKTAEEVVKITRRTVDQTKIYIGLESLDFAVKGGRVPAVVNKIAKTINMNPILVVDKAGKMGVGGKTFGARNRPDKLLKFVLKKLDKTKRYRFGVAYTTNHYEAHRIAHRFRQLAGNENVFFAQVGPALSVHGGPGTIAIATQEIEEAN